MTWTLTHDFLYNLGGAERVTASLAQDVLPSARVRVIDYRSSVVEGLGLGEGRVSHLSAPASLVSNPRHYRRLAPIIAALVRQIHVEGNVLASSYAFSHYVQTEATKVVYCHSPLRQLWAPGDGEFDKIPSWPRRAAFTRMRAWDARQAARCDAYISSGPVVTSRIRAYYGISPIAEISPPIETNVFLPGSESDDYFIYSGRIVEPYKRLAPVIEAFRELPYKLVVAGDGRDRRRLEATAPNNVHFVGPQPTAALAALMARALGSIFPSADDFGMSPLEAISCGTPVLAFAGGGAPYNLTPGLNSLLFDSHDSSSLKVKIRELAVYNWDRALIRESALVFSRERFAQRMKALLGEFE